MDISSEYHSLRKVLLVYIYVNIYVCMVIDMAKHPPTLDDLLNFIGGLTYEEVQYLRKVPV